ncbi:pyridoxamine 5'-phosphate oxidase family protein [Dactylosporangium sp. AC04546]|uniref:pyridoxamine 5'-phosphate oxidase family protein n=1 Tax=Dactylosporangium sp. AC04546 TaxID=2862460 RepID=UPI001EDD9258|nr:pyridoxamine 5'-phosphate oxidase family protein [Dactylosporangium sp. AC04546]WVK81239.1 pyridoxamine 5'-phosphate oxidase family protein [Dactylosporangium sp. AC04546]
MSATVERIWRDLTKASFAVLGYVTPAGEPRSSGVVYIVDRRRMYVAVAEDSWKARHVGASGRVAVTVPVRRGGVMALLFPIPPATISFHGTATVHPAEALPDGPLARLVPPERRAGCRVIEIVPVGHFVTYGEGVPLARMRTPSLARGRLPVD